MKRTTKKLIFSSFSFCRNSERISENITRVFRHHASLHRDKFPHLEEDLEQGGGGGVEILDNLDWYRDVGLLDFLSARGRHFRMGKLLRTRLVQSSSAFRNLKFRYFTKKKNFSHSHSFVTSHLKNEILKELPFLP